MVHQLDIIPIHPHQYHQDLQQLQLVVQIMVVVVDHLQNWNEGIQKEMKVLGP
jgi:hypothetical protein